jgi:hypothetical protein
LIGKIQEGQGVIYPTSVNEQGDYVIAVRPVYPPKQFAFMIYFGEKQVNVVREPLSTVVDTYFDWTKTEIHGDQISGDRVDKALHFDILLRDTKEQCYEFPKEVTVIAKGPFASQDLHSDEPAP